MASRHVKTVLEWSQFRIRLARRPKFLKVFPLRSVGFCLRVGRAGSRGATPLLVAAENGHDGVVQQLLEAKAAVDAKDEDGRGLRREFLGKPPEAWIVVRKWRHVDD